MKSRPYRLVLSVFGLLLAVFLFSGCSKVYTCKVDISVGNSADGNPLGGVDVVTIRSFDTPESVRTSDVGKATLILYIDQSGFNSGAMPRKSITPMKKGFVNETIDISPIEMPKSMSTMI